MTVLELLSPTNKEQPGRSEYLQKRNAILHQQVHLVELDVLVGGQRPPLQKPWPPGDYHYLVSRWQDRPDSQVYSWTVRDPLPTLPVPLRHGDPEVVIDLGAVFATAFERGRFARRLARRGECPAPLSAESKAWAEQIAASATN